MPSPQSGDRLRATLGDSTIVGTVAEVTVDGTTVQLDDGGTVTLDLPWVLEVIAAPPTPTVPSGTVVLDRIGIAWQSGPAGAMTPAMAATVLPQYASLDALDSARGPLTLMEVASA